MHSLGSGKLNWWLKGLSLFYIFKATAKMAFRKMCQLGSSLCGSVETNLTRIYEDSGLSPGPIQWVKDSVLPWAVVWVKDTSPDAELLWLWHRLAAVALIWPLAWEQTNALDVALKKKKKKKKERCINCNSGQCVKQWLLPHSLTKQWLLSIYVWIFLWPHLQNMEVPGLGVELEQQPKLT